MTIRTCLCLITRTAPGGAGGADLDVLLGFKKTGFGAGKWVGLGGHLEDGEEPAAAAAREVAEESSLIVEASALVHVATLAFAFPARRSWDQTAEVFMATSFRGEPGESAELVPRWFAADALPFDLMWDDARYWVPAVLSGQRVRAGFTFADDCATVQMMEPDLRPAGPRGGSLLA